MSVVKIIESPRDAWQGLPKVMKPEVKAEYLRRSEERRVGKECLE